MVTVFLQMESNELISGTRKCSIALATKLLYLALDIIHPDIRIQSSKTGIRGKNTCRRTCQQKHSEKTSSIEMDHDDVDSPLNKKPRLNEETKDGTFIELTKSQVPEYLRTSEFFASLSPEDDAPFPVPICCFKRDIAVVSDEDVRKLLSTVRFWGVKGIVPGLVEYCRKNKLHEDVVSEFENELRYVKALPFFYKAPQKGVMRHALLAGQLTLVCHLLHTGYCFSHCSISHAIEGGNLDCVEYVSRHAPTILMDRIHTHLQECAKFGRLDCLVYLHTLSEHPITVECANAAIRKNQADCLQYVMENMQVFGYCYHWAVMAAELGHLACLRKLLTFIHGDCYFIATCTAAARHGHLNCLIFAHELRPDVWSQSTCTAAATNGHLDCLMYAHNHGCPWDHSACSSAARNGHLAVLQYLHENGCKWNKQTILQAIKYNQRECLEYALRQQCYHTDQDALCTLAASAGATQCLQCLCEQGYACDEGTMDAASQGGHNECVGYLVFKDIPMVQKKTH